jgi:hypothetical protein
MGSAGTDHPVIAPVKVLDPSPADSGVGPQTLIPDTWPSLADKMAYEAEDFRVELWTDVDAYLEIWSEAASMDAVLWPVAEEPDVFLRPAAGSARTPEAIKSLL